VVATTFPFLVQHNTAFYSTLLSEDMQKQGLQSTRQKRKKNKRAKSKPNGKIRANEAAHM